MSDVKRWISSDPSGLYVNCQVVRADEYDNVAELVCIAYDYLKSDWDMESVPLNKIKAFADSYIESDDAGTTKPRGNASFDTMPPPQGTDDYDEHAALHTPMSAQPYPDTKAPIGEAYLSDDGKTIIIANPVGYDLDESHNCDQMGCRAWHVLYRLPKPVPVGDMVYIPETDVPTLHAEIERLRKQIATPPLPQGGEDGLTLWVSERFENCHRIAETKTGADRDGWLEDARYFGALLRLLATPPATPLPNEASDTALHKVVEAQWKKAVAKRRAQAEDTYQNNLDRLTVRQEADIVMETCDEIVAIAEAIQSAGIDNKGEKNV